MVVDVLSFTTCLSVATERGTAVYPYAFGDGSALDYAQRHDATLAVGRRQVGSSGAVSLSPASILAAPPMDRLVLPSPNGSALSLALADSGATVVGACLRNRSAVAGWLRTALVDDAEFTVTVIAAGEHWPDGSLRPAVQDLWGAGAVEASLEAAMLECPSGQELATADFADDVRIAAQLDVSEGVPLLEREFFTARRA